MGVPSEETVEERAMELAVIAGRSISQVTEEDRAQARRELLGEGMIEEESEEDEAVIAGTLHFDEAPGTTGHHVTTHGPEDETSVGERLVQEGADEALHDEMLEAHKKNIDEAS